MSIFKNGNRRIARLMILELVCASLLLAGTQILGNLPAQDDWLSPIVIKKAAFLIGCGMTLLKACEMFFSKTASMFKNHEIPSGDTEIFSRPAAPPAPPV